MHLRAADRHSAAGDADALVAANRECGYGYADSRGHRDGAPNRYVNAGGDDPNGDIQPDPIAHQRADDRGG